MMSGFIAPPPLRPRTDGWTTLPTAHGDCCRGRAHAPALRTHGSSAASERPRGGLRGPRLGKAPPKAGASSLCRLGATRGKHQGVTPRGSARRGSPGGVARPLRLELRGLEVELDGAAVLGEVVAAEVAAVAPVPVAQHQLDRARQLAPHASLDAAEQVDARE